MESNQLLSPSIYKSAYHLQTREGRNKSFLCVSRFAVKFAVSLLVHITFFQFGANFNLKYAHVEKVNILNVIIW